MPGHFASSTEAGRAIELEDTLKLANSHLQSKRLEEAELIYRQVLAVNPRQFDALYFLGVIALQTSKFEQAAELLRQAIQQNPSSYTAHNNLGVALIHQGKLKEAIRSIYQALSLKQDYQPAKFNLARANQRLGNLGLTMETLAYWTGFIRFTPSNAQLIWKPSLDT